MIRVLFTPKEDRLNLDIFELRKYYDIEGFECVSESILYDNFDIEQVLYNLNLKDSQILNIINYGYDVVFKINLLDRNGIKYWIDEKREGINGHVIRVKEMKRLLC